MIDLSSLNEEQKKAVLTTEGYVRVIASPGSGKTRALTHRFAYLVDDLKVEPDNILCITYTNKAADEMKERIIKLLSSTENHFSTISTIHSYCASFLRLFFSNTPIINKDFSILDEMSFNKTIRSIYKKETGENPDVKVLSRLKKEISYYKVENIDYVAYLLGINDDFEFDNSLVEEVVKASKKNNGLFFEDLICATIYILEKYPTILEKEARRFKYILVDEFQDTTYTTYRLIKMLSSYHNNLFVVGDIDQSIYSFIQAEPSILLNSFIKDFPNTKTLTMNNNYRSTEEIINASNVLIQHNKERYSGKKTISATKKQGIPVVRSLDGNNKTENTILRIIEHLHDDLGQNYSDIFLIGRNNYEHEPIKKMLSQKGIPFIDSRTVGKENGNSPAVDELISCIMFAKNGNIFDFSKLNSYQELNVPSNIIDDAINGKINIERYLEENSKIYSDFIERNNVTKEILLNDKLKIFEKLISISGEHRISEKIEFDYLGYQKVLLEAQPLAEFVKFVKYIEETNLNVSMWDIIDRVKLDNTFSTEKKQDGVRLLTAHGSKGLESKSVIVFGNKIESFETEEDIRLAYVAITRAKEYLFIVSDLKQRYKADLINRLYDCSQNLEDYFEIQYNKNLNFINKYYKNLNEEKIGGLKLLMCGENVFLTGEGGTGKTFLINKYIRYLRDIGKTTLICAPTGIAANNYPGGKTIHSAFGIKPYPSIIFDERTPTKRINCDVLIIDEISMCRIDMFEYIMKIVEYSSNEGHKIQVVLCGDFFQLPPVVLNRDEKVLKELFKNFKEGFAFESEYWKKMKFKSICLKEIFRQDANEDNFVESLNSIRKGNNVDNSINYINNYCSKIHKDNAIEIHSKNSTVKQFNDYGLASCCGEEHIYYAEYRGTIGEDINVDKEIHLKPGARVMMTVNNDWGIAYRNGSLGTIALCGDEFVDVILDEGGCVRVTKSDFNSLGDPKIESIYGKRYIIQEVLGSIKQLPVKLAYAITIHKSQGQTYEHVNLDPDGWENGQLYVALSRIKSLKNLFLYKPIDSKVIKTSDNVIEFYKNLK